MFRDGVPLCSAAATYVNDLILPNHQGWNSRRINELFIPRDAHLIKIIELPLFNEVQDQSYWPFNRSGSYSTKSGYNYILQQQSQEIHSMTGPAHTTFFRQFWSLNIMPKWKMFI